MCCFVYVQVWLWYLYRVSSGVGGLLVFVWGGVSWCVLVVRESVRGVPVAVLGGVVRVLAFGYDVAAPWVETEVRAGCASGESAWGRFVLSRDGPGVR